MSRWRRERLALGLDSRALLRAGSAAPPVALATAEPTSGWPAAHLRDAIRAQMAPGASYAVLQVLVGADLCRHFVHQAPAGVRSLAELRLLAANRASQLYGEKPVDWAVVADWTLAQPFACAALPAALLQSLQQAAGELKLSLTVESAVLVALERLGGLPQVEGFVAWTTPSCAVLAHLSGAGVNSLRCLRRVAGSDEVELLARELRQESLRAKLPGDVLRLASAGPSVQRTDAGLQVERFDAGAVLPAQSEADTEATWACRLALLAEPMVRAGSLTR
ncbi:hypothetical protein ACVNIS_10635 [Sphaerotilaceae bacterium SBD11-9]